MLTEPQSLFLDALMSGNFTQASNRLRGEDSMGDQQLRLCCLGVACEVYRANYVPTSITDPDVPAWERAKTGLWGFLGATHAMPRTVAEWLGTVSNPRLWRDTNDNREREGTSAGAANDAYQFEFPILAALFHYHFTHNGAMFVGSKDDVRALAGRFSQIHSLTAELKAA